MFEGLWQLNNKLIELHKAVTELQAATEAEMMKGITNE